MAYGRDALRLFLEACYPLSSPTERLLLTFWMRPIPDERLTRAKNDLTTYLLENDRLLTPQVRTRLVERTDYTLLEVAGSVSLTGPDRTALLRKARSIAAVMSGYFDGGFGGLRLDDWQWQPAWDTPFFLWPEEAPSLVLSFGELAALFHVPSDQLGFVGVTYQTLPAVPIPQLLLHNRGLVLGHATERGKSVAVRVPYEDTYKGGVFVPLGATGQGKTVLAQNYVCQALALPQRIGAGVVDIHNRLAIDIAGTLPKHREKDALYLAFGDTDHPPSLALFAKPPGVPIDYFIENTFAIFRLIFHESWNSNVRMQDGIWAVVSVLCRREGSSLLDILPLFTDTQFRRQALARLGTSDPVAREFWREYKELSPSAKRDLTGPIFRRMRALYRNPAVRNIFGQKTGLDFGTVLAQRTILLWQHLGKQLPQRQHSLAR